jgi:hexosaminidase
MYDPILTVTRNSAAQLLVVLETEISGLTIHYTDDNTIPNKYSSVYNQGTPIVIPHGADNLKIITYRDDRPIGRLLSFRMEDLEKRIKGVDHSN